MDVIRNIKIIQVLPVVPCLKAVFFPHLSFSLLVYQDRSCCSSVHGWQCKMNILVLSQFPTKFYAYLHASIVIFLIQVASTVHLNSTSFLGACSDDTSSLMLELITLILAPELSFQDKNPKVYLSFPATCQQAL